ncbi:MAG: OmpA family protein [Parvularculaceae bacterium]|nr:OmpA family protein [Parvularculaceae bacterium]
MKGLLIALSFLVLASAPAAAADVKGAADYPGIGRFAGSEVTGYEVRDFDAEVVQATAFKQGKPVDARTVQGKVTRIAYKAPDGASMLEVFANYRNKAAAAGFEILLDCETDVCGGMDFAAAVRLLPIPQMWFDGFNYRYLSARRRAGASGPEAWVVVVTSQNNDTVYTQATVVELGALENKMIDAAAMKKGLKEEGRIALYGVYFDTAKADVKPESAPTLAEIAKLLKGDGSLTTVYIVGHTDSQGGYDYNIDLSRRRAAAIAAELVSKHGVAAGRLKTAGVGFLAPIASNATEDGRALNRRTELVVP